MKKINLLVDLIKEFLTAPVALLKHNMHYLISKNKKKQTINLGFEKGLPTVNIHDLVGKLNTTVNHYTFLEGTSYVNDIAFLKSLAGKIPNCDYLEIGSWRGESIINVAEHTKECYSLSLSHDEMRAMGFDKGFIESDGIFFKDNPKIKSIRHNSLTYDFSQLNKKFDLIFVDGGHAYEEVLSDTINAFKLLKDENSIIVWHDCGISFEDQRWEVIAAVIEGTPVDKRKFLYRVSNTLCGVFIQKEFKREFKSFPSKPDKIFTVKINSEEL